jgi:hypothetical protein
VAVEFDDTEAGVAEATLTLLEPGQIDIVAAAGPAVISDKLTVSVLIPPTPSPAPVMPLPSATPTEPPTATPTPTAEPSATPPAPPPVIEENPLPPPPETLRRLDGFDFLLALGATLSAGLIGFWLGRLFPKPLPRRVRLGLWVLIGGLAAYLLYGAGWLRPEEWLFEQPTLWASRLAMAGLSFLFGLLALALNSQSERQQRVGS